MPTITDWLMVGITAVYVLATIFICRANIKSAEATKAQLAESRRQFSETKRLEMMPYIQVETSTEIIEEEICLVLDQENFSERDYYQGNQCNLHIAFENIGNGTAKNIRYRWNSLSGSYNRGQFPVRSLLSGEKRILMFEFSYPADIKDTILVSLDFTYEDLLDHIYTQRLSVYFRKKAGDLEIYHFAVFAPQMQDKETTHA